MSVMFVCQLVFPVCVITVTWLAALSRNRRIPGSNSRTKPGARFFRRLTNGGLSQMLSNLIQIMFTTARGEWGVRRGCVEPCAMERRMEPTAVDPHHLFTTCVLSPFLGTCFCVGYRGIRLRHWLLHSSSNAHTAINPANPRWGQHQQAHPTCIGLRVRGGYVMDRGGQHFSGAKLVGMVSISGCIFEIR